jgi:hypothetical protein
MAPKTKTNTWPVIMYPEGVNVGKVRSGRQRPDGPVRHVAYDAAGTRVGTLDSFFAAQQLLLHRARGTCPDRCPACGMDLKSDGYPLEHKSDEGRRCWYRWTK